MGEVSEKGSYGKIKLAGKIYNHDLDKLKETMTDIIKSTGIETRTKTYVQETLEIFNNVGWASLFKKHEPEFDRKASKLEEDLGLELSSLKYVSKKDMYFWGGIFLGYSSIISFLYFPMNIIGIAMPSVIFPIISRLCIYLDKKDAVKRASELDSLITKYK